MNNCSPLFRTWRNLVATSSLPTFVTGKRQNSSTYGLRVKIMDRNVFVPFDWLMMNNPEGKTFTLNIRNPETPYSNETTNEYPCLSSAGEYQTALDLANSLSDCRSVYNRFQANWKEETAVKPQQIEEGINRFDATDVPFLEDIENIQQDLLIYRELYNIYKENPKCFYHYYELCNIINDLVNKTKKEREIQRYIREYITHHHKDGYKLKRLTFNNNRRCLAYYDPNIQIINFGPAFFNLPLSCQAFTLLHELKHTTQRPGLIGDVFAQAKDEREAEEFAASNLNCDVCLQIQQLHSKYFPIDEVGYFKARDYQQYIESAKTLKKRCRQHCSDPSLLLNELQRNRPSWYDVKKLDSTNGTIVDRLPTIPR